MNGNGTWIQTLGAGFILMERVEFVRRDGKSVKLYTGGDDEVGITVNDPEEIAKVYVYIGRRPKETR